MLQLPKIPLPNDLTPEQREAFEALTAHVSALEDYGHRQDNLVRELQRLLRGKKSEKLTPDERQLAFEDLEISISDNEAKGDALKARTGTEAKTQPAKRNLGDLPKHLDRIEQVIEPDTLECPCGCGQMHKIGEDRSERLDIIPAQVRVIVTIRPKYGCRSCGDGVTQAPAPAYLIAGALPTEGTIAHVLVGKYADHSPLYRQSQILARSGLEIDRSTLANWVGKAAFHLEPVFERLASHIKTSTKLFMDETTAPVLDPGRGRTKTGYLWALARDDRAWQGNDPPGVVYYYAPGRSGEHAEKFLNGFNGILQIDGYAGYNRLAKLSRQGGDPVEFAYCWAHCRRKLREVFDRDGSQIAAEGLRRIAEFYAIEAEIRGMSAQERLDIRQARTAPLIADFETWLDQQRAKVSPKSRLGEKLGYIARHWAGLQTFLEDGRVEIDSNLVENQIRPLALNRKNALFAGHDTGGKAWGIIASLIATAKTNNVEPFAYLKETLEAVAQGHPKSRIDELLPWNWKKSQA
jgi:transposase